MKLYKKQLLNVLYQFCDFLAYQKTKITTLVDLLRKVEIALRYIICGTLGPLFILIIWIKFRKSWKKKCAKFHEYAKLLLQ